jgi:methyl-accepting chemotaxis protein
MSLTIKTKLSIGLVIVILFTGMLGMWAIMVQDRLGKSIGNLEAQAEKLSLVSDLQLAIEKLLMPANDYIITGKQSYVDEFASLAAVVEKIYGNMRTNVNFDQHQRATIDNTYKMFLAVKESGDGIFRLDYRDPRQGELMEAMDYNYAAPMDKELEELNKQIKLTFGRTQKEAKELRNVSRISVITAVLILTVVLVTSGYYLRRTIANSLDSLIGAIKEIAEGKGDLTVRIAIKSRDELGTLSFWFNKFSDHLQTMMQEVSVTSREVSLSAQAIANASTDVHRVAATQFAEIDVTSQATERLNVAIRGIADDSALLLELSSHVASSSLEISASIASVAEMTVNLDMVADASLSSVNEINVTFSHVADSVRELSDRADNVVASAIQINAVTRNINDIARDQAVMAEQMKEEAFSIGVEAIKKTRASMERIRTEVTATAAVMADLGTVSTEINRIVRLIGEITDKTKLLALNASILAAQAGDQGKGFAVVAEEVKELAAKTSISTSDISAMIKQVQEGTAIAISAADRNTREVEDGVRLSLEAETVFAAIIGKTENSLEYARRVARAAEEQAVGVGIVTEAVQQIQQMIAKINNAVSEQKKAADGILAASEHVHTFTREARETIAVQSEETQRMTRMFREINDRVEMIVETTTEQQKLSTEIVQALATVHVKAEENIKLATGLDGIVANLDSQSKLLSAKVGNFKV